MYPKNRFVKLNERKHLVKDFFRLSMGLFNCFDFEQSLRGQRNSFVVRNIIWFSLLIFFEFHHVEAGAHCSYFDIYISRDFEDKFQTSVQV